MKRYWYGERQYQQIYWQRDQEDIPSLSRVPGTNTNYKSGGTNNFHAQMADKMGEQFKGKINISPCPRCNPLDKEQTLRAELLCNLVANCLWVLQEVPAQV